MALVSRAVLTVCAVTAATSLVHATVTQVDGTIIPATGALQGFLDDEGETLNAVLDAAELPQVFLPNTTQPVVFRDIAEGAGFENSFGWYNVGDDVLTTAGRAQNLHPIFGCGVPMENHAYDPGNPGAHDDHQHGNPTYYVQDAEPGDQVSVDFGAEAAAGRYKGGFIAFYLITPEGHPDGNDDNCGDADYLTRDDYYFGFIYFTQKDLNDDGDFVHHLVYTSDQGPDRFYFGFEDLFRGGDNDYEDMLIRVDGLTPPCTPTAEICDGKDNDCDGQVDAADPDLTGVGDACLCDGVDLTCADGVVFGACQAGETICVAGGLQCTSTTGPTDELCDGIDNDCNNNVDDDPIDVGDPCDGPDADLCPEGVIICTGGAPACSDTTGPNDELCNNMDDDCDMVVDEDVVDEGASCGTDVGVCESGVELCMNGSLECFGATAGGDEVCNGLDDDCDGVPDDNPTDVGMTCGATDVGECEYGVTICNGGVLDCAGDIGPVPETCNTLDDDCNGVEDDDPVDVGSPCGSDVGVCEPGTVVCTAAGPVCQGDTTGSGEQCNGLDDDCDGVVDDNPAGTDEVCGEGDGVCEPGLLKCIDGGLQCVGGFDGTTETCNGLDDDCDGTIDEGDLCDGGVCGDGVCSAACLPGEFPCAIDEICQDGFCVPDPCFGITCGTGPGGEAQTCVDGVCQDVCDTITCPGDLVCRTDDGVCVPDNCNFLPLCAEDELCDDGVCVRDDCASVECPEDQGQFCRDGACVNTCAGIECGDGEVCRDGTCEATGCPQTCPDDQVCDAGTGTCVTSPCRGVTCERNDVCDPSTGECIDDPCFGIDCPGDQVCNLGDCFERPPDGDAGVDQYITAAGGGGCSAGGDAGWLAALLGVVLLVGRRRWALIVLAALALGQAGCDVNGYCITCEKAGVGDDGGTDMIDAGTDMIDARVDAGPGCEMGVVRAEECDGLDNDCDGPVDEEFDLDSDPFNCGACGVDCLKDGARTLCNQGGCEIIECSPGNLDLNGDTAGPFDDSDGCEYDCFVSNGGVEACDGLDNDCDGATDEDTNFDEDEQNCGQCGRVCGFFEATATCVMGTCAFDPATDCSDGFIDLDMDQSTGCEYQCTPTGAEDCDLRDDDCDGGVDEDFDLDTSADHCGQCGNACKFPNAIASCAMGQCVFDPATDCQSGYHDVNGDQLDGCEYACTPANGGIEICDQLDNDCNGQVDDMPVDAGLACHNAPGGTATGICTATGTTVCSLGTIVCLGAPEPTTETCNDADDDCDTEIDEDVTRSCYSGPMGTQGVGVCRGGTETCSAGTWSGTCAGQVPPGNESCNNADDDCDTTIDEAIAGGGPFTRTCYTGTPGTAGRGTCTTGIQTCSFGVFGTCQGEIVDQPFDLCGDGLDTDCDDLDDTGEGCAEVSAAEVRLDAAGGGLGTDPGEAHSFDLQLAAGGVLLGSNVYAVWSDLSNGNSDIYFRRSTDGGQSWGTIQNLTSGITRAAVKPLIAVAPGSPDTVHVVFQTVNGGIRSIRATTSTDGGTSFSTPTGALQSDGDCFHHDIAVSPDGETLLVAWEQLDTDTLTRNVVSRVSLDAGDSFEAERTINVGSGAFPIAGRPRVGITSGGRYVFVWREKRSGDTLDVYAAFSDSDTAAPASDTRLDNDVDDDRDSDFPVLAVSEDDVYLVWQDISTLPGGGSDVYFVRSTNGGASFSSEAILDDPVLEQSASFTPTLTLDSGGAGPGDDRLWVAWEDRREGTQIYVAASTDGGASFAAGVRASSSSAQPIGGVTRNPVIAFTGGDVIVVAYGNDDGSGALHVYAATSVDGGLSWQITHQRLDTGAGDALLPMITRAFGGGITFGAAVGWLDFRAGTQINGDPYLRRIGQ